MQTLLYLDGSCGISGDMTVAALLDLGADRAKLDAALAPLAAEGLSYEISRKTSHGLAGCDFDVHLPEHHHHEGEHHHHDHRHLADVEHVLGHLPMTDRARAIALRTFRIVAEAEAKAHGVPLEEVHFHEVGALDSIADIVGAAVLFDDLGVQECVVTRLCEGTGTVVCAHGELPVPVPATLNVAQAHAIPLEITAVRGERVTPTGIALAAALRTRDTLPAPFTVAKVGVGLGKRDIGAPNALRAMLIQADGPAERLHVLEANIDDSTGGVLAAAAKHLLALGARDVCFIPCTMKKGRPGHLLTVLCEPDREEALIRAVLTHTSTIGLRVRRCEKYFLTPGAGMVSTPYGPVAIKTAEGFGLSKAKPEHDSVSAAAQAQDVPYQTVWQAACKAL